MTKVRIGVIGAGWWATAVYLPALKADPRVEVVAVNRLGAAELEAVRSKFDIPAAFPDYREMLAASQLDGIVIGSPHVFHFEQAKAALEHGAHVLVDKPMTTSTADAHALMAVARARNLQLIVSYGWNFTLIAREARRLIGEGCIGEIRHIVLNMASPLRDLFGGEGLVEANEAMFQPAATTWSDPARAGGYGWGQLSHALGLLFHVTDLEPTEVYAASVPSRTGVDLYAASVMRFRNGATGVMSGAGTLPKHVSDQVELRLFGTEGTLLIDLDGERLELRRDDKADNIMPLAPGSGAYPLGGAIANLVDICCGVTVESAAPARVGQLSVEVLDAFYRSLASGRAEVI